MSARARDRATPYPVHGSPVRWSSFPTTSGEHRGSVRLTARGRWAAGVLIAVGLLLLLVACALIGDQQRCDRLAPTGVDHDERAFRYYCQDTP